MAGIGVIRHDACDELVAFAEQAKLPVATTFMAKGAIPFSHANSWGTVGLQAHDYVACGFDRADAVVCIGFDIVEYKPFLWTKSNSAKIIHVDTQSAEIDEHYLKWSTPSNRHSLTFQ